MARRPIPLNHSLCPIDRYRYNRWRHRRILCIRAMVAALELRVTEAQIIRSAKSSHRSTTNDSACLPTSNWKSWARKISKITLRVIWVSWIETRGAFECILEAIRRVPRILSRHNSTLWTRSPIGWRGTANRLRATRVQARRSASSKKSSRKKLMRMRWSTTRTQWSNRSYHRM